ncbi:ABC transporter permease, partial [Staphylococcus epidermidis]
LPVIALSVGMSAYYVRLMRSNLVELYQSKEVEAARLRGMSERYILWQDLFKPAIIPIITVLGMSVGSLIGGTVVIENLFGIPGIGHFLVD